MAAIGLRAPLLAIGILVVFGVMLSQVPAPLSRRSEYQELGLQRGDRAALARLSETPRSRFAPGDFTMHATRRMRTILRFTRPLEILLACGALCQAAAGADLFLTDARAFPGQLWLSLASSAERSIYRREAVANPAFPRAATKLAQVAVGPDGKIYFTSGLDGYVMHLLDRRHEVVSFEFAGQIRDLGCSDEEHTVYFSVVPTPQNGEPLADGKIYRRDIWAGQPSELATIRQSQIGGGWWGTFAVRGDVFYLTTFENPSRIFKLTSGDPEPFAVAPFKIHGIAAGPDGAFYLTDGSNKVYRTADFQNVEVVLRAERAVTDVAPGRPITGGTVAP